MFIDDEFWSLFQSDGGPQGGAFWLVAPFLLALVLPPLVLLAGIIIELVFKRPGDR